MNNSIKKCMINKSVSYVIKHCTIYLHVDEKQLLKLNVLYFCCFNIV